MKRTHAKASKKTPAKAAKPSGSFLFLASQRTSRRFGVAISGSLLIHALMFGTWLSASLVRQPEILEIREVSFLDENEISPAIVEPEVPIGSGRSMMATEPGVDGEGETAPRLESFRPPANTTVENQSGSINAVPSESEVDVNKMGVLGFLDGVSESSNSRDVLALNMQAADGAVESLKMNRSLTVGRGQNPTGKIQDGALFASSRKGVGIDDLLEVDLNAGEGVALRKGARVQFTGFSSGSGGSGGAYGARSEASLYAVLQKHMGRLQYIYEKYLQKNPSLGGKIEVEVVINANGAVAKVSFLSSDIGVPEFLEELAAVIRRWKYEAIDEGIVRVVYPLVFVKVG
ncbi:MAG: AgmX/PglI C-terminal domain-containing protein [candidate division KSB1 bacterium]|nr:AgmX/PglI C-terminal domain-containing protein [candidate division KSB1 bacterium]